MVDVCGDTPTVRDATFEEACLPLAKDGFLEKLTEAEQEVLTQKALAEPILMDPDTFQPFKAVDGIRYDLEFMSNEH